MDPIAVLCGGLGTRMRPATASMPKALFPVLGEPFIAHLLRLLAKHAFPCAVLCVAYLGEMIEEFVGDGRRFGIDVRYSYDGPAPIGTAGAIAKARNMLGEQFFTIYGDAYLPCDYAAIGRAFERAGTMGLMTVNHNRGAGGASNVWMAGNAIRDYRKGGDDPRYEYIDYGVEVFRAAAFDGVPANAATDLGVVIRSLIAAQSLATFEVREQFFEVGSPEGLAATTAYLQEHPL